ncbi:STAS domain-containing protein [Micromonospora sp. LH3U1]|uniref:STAS domain-containing protein n=1 Tax=Micromonospora sp. LH3U1 TaxID=3018339 RepID=UPI0023498106|nr:STAS domain-containing protein [Micromonospora sp. LH3U1]WCN79386.1 STAS domain-containing protein [Micromonospora sp. LH3U1]
MSLTLIRDGSFSLISAAGEIDMSNAHLLTELVEFLCRAPAPLITVDLSAVRFFGAHGISALLRASQEVAWARGRLTLRAPSPFVLRVLGVAGVMRHLELDVTSTPARAPITRVRGPHPPTKERHVQSTGPQGDSTREPDSQLA